MNRFQLGALACALVLNAFACGPQQGGSLTLAIHTPMPRTSEVLRGAPPVEIDNDITDFRLCVSAPDVSLADCDQFNLEDFKSRGNTARLGGLPIGKNRTITFQGYDGKDNKFPVIWCGEVGGVEIRDDETTSVSMFISACRDFSHTSNEMGIERFMHTATLLQDGRVLIVGGYNVLKLGEFCIFGNCHRLEATTSVDIYDPATGEFDSATGLALNHARGMHTATLLNDGRVLIAGGCHKAVYRTAGLGTLLEVDDNDGWGLAGSIAEIVDPAAGTVTALEEAPMPTSRALHDTFTLPNGDVFLLGGIGPAGTSLASGAYYLASQGQFVDIPAILSTSREGMTVVPFGDGEQAVVWGGNHPAQPKAGTYAEILTVDENNEVVPMVPQFVTLQGDQGIPAFNAAGVLLPSGEVLLTGGLVVDTIFDPSLTKPRAMSDFRLLDLTTGAERVTAPENPSHTMGFFSALHNCTLLGRRNTVDQNEDPDVKVLVAGGLTPTPPSMTEMLQPQNKAMFFHPWEDENNLFRPEQIEGNAVALIVPRAGHTATALPDGTVLITGGLTGVVEQVSGQLELSLTKTAEVFNGSSRSLRRK